MYRVKKKTLKVIFKTIISFLVTAALPTVVGVSYIAGASLSFPVIIPAGSPADQIFAFGTLLPFSFGVALIHVLIFGVPAFLLGLRFRAIHWWSCIIVAFIIGITPLAILYLPLLDFDFLPFGLLGAIGGLTFWLLWRFWVRYER